MAMDRSFEAKNREARERLRKLVARLGDTELQRPVGHGWTVADSLVHLAFWDLRAATLIGRFEQGGAAPSPADADVINDAVLALGRAIPPREAADLAVRAAEAVDRRLEGLSDRLLEAVPAAGNPFSITRHVHRLEHVEEIERAVTAYA